MRCFSMLFWTTLFVCLHVWKFWFFTLSGKTFKCLKVKDVGELEEEDTWGRANMPSAHPQVNSFCCLSPPSPGGGTQGLASVRHLLYH